MRTGRPKAHQKRDGRKHTIRLSEQAEFLIREVKKQRPNFELGPYISSRIIRDFEKSEEQWIIEQMVERDKQIKALYREHDSYAERLRNIRETRSRDTLLQLGDD